jgi:murein DD-endopeptidase MepM/ murein hydrolase activator NlpD
LWRGLFCTPIDIIKTTCDYGTIRTTQRKGRYAHKAVDVINTPGCVVWAPQDGMIAMKERFAYTGNTIVIDHGWGIVSIFCHLEDFAKISVGDRIAQGNPIGTMGKTGYATGYHLHWEMRIGNTPVDPLQWTKTGF